MTSSLRWSRTSPRYGSGNSADDASFTVPTPRAVNQRAEREQPTCGRPVLGLGGRRCCSRSWPVITGGRDLLFWLRKRVAEQVCRQGLVARPWARWKSMPVFFSHSVQTSGNYGPLTHEVVPNPGPGGGMDPAASGCVIFSRTRSPDWCRLSMSFECPTLDGCGTEGAQ